MIFSLKVKNSRIHDKLSAYLYYNSQHHFVSIFAHNSTVSIARDFNIVDFAPTHKAKLMVEVWFESGKVEFSSQKAIIRPSRQNYR